MLSCFPDPYPDELLYSICARYGNRMRFPNKRSISQEVFGQISPAVIDFPSRLGTLIASLPTKDMFTINQLIDEHTMLPLYRLFIPPDRYQQVRIAMERDDRSVKTRVGTQKSTISIIPWFRFCPECAADERLRYGECYWHRLHQVPGVEVCLIHDVFLKASTAGIPHRYDQASYYAAEDVVQIEPAKPLHHSNPIHYALRLIAKDVEWLLQDRTPLPSDCSTLPMRYRILLEDRQLATPKGVFKGQAFIKAFTQHYGIDFLVRMGCTVDNKPNNWLIRLTRQNSSIRQPLYHLLLMQFLGYTAAEFAHLPSTPRYFGSGPWPCINPVCEHYQKRVIQHYYVRSRDKHQRHIGYFVCTCGYTYTQKSGNHDIDQWEQMAHVTAYGSVWEAALRRIWEDPLTNLTQKGKQLGCSRRVVKYNGLRLGLSFPIPGTQCWSVGEPIPGPPRRIENLEERREKYRAIWLHAMEIHPTYTISMLADSYSTIYLWLNQHDREWVQAHRPSQVASRGRNTSVDWNARDQSLADYIKVRNVQLHNHVGRPRKITISALLAGADLPLVQMSLDKLPLTSEAMVAAIETPQGFAIRKIEWTVKYFLEQGVTFTRFQLVRTAAVDKLKQHPDVKAAIDTMFSTH